MDLKTLLKVDQNQDKNITYQYGRSKTNENENDHRIYRRRMCLKHVHRVQLTSGAPNENIVQNHLNIALLNVF